MDKFGWLIILLVLIFFTLNIYAHKTLIDPKACTINLLKDKKEFSVYFQAVEKEDVEILLTFKSIDLDTNTKNKLGKTLLFYAAQEGKIESIKLLVSKVDINVNSRDEDSRTAFHYAALDPNLVSRTSTVYTLVRLGADIQATDRSGHRPSEYVQGVRHTIDMSQQQEYQAIYLAIKTDDILEISELLQLSHNILPSLVHDFRMNNHLTVH